MREDGTKRNNSRLDRIRKRRLTWFVYVGLTRTENGRLSIMALHGQLHVDGRRDRGRPTKTWMDNIMEDIKHRAWIFEKRRINPGRDELGDFLLGPHHWRTPGGEEN